ncbi:MAG: electron transfer flavoprotein subunit alpha/FixB family protein [Pseudomonadota bacterium]|nr:electron transfer flavoprotein subunit alpha/FixB family protein [Pseudomonadota bacterium]
MKQILVIAEIWEGQIRPVTWELVAAARKIKNSPALKQLSPTINIIVPADDPAPLAEKIAKQTGIDVIGLQIPELETYISEIYIYCLEQLMRANPQTGDSYENVFMSKNKKSTCKAPSKKMNPSHILIAHTSQGQDFAPGLALSLNAASIPGVNGIRYDEEGVIYSRPGFNNTRNLMIRPAANRPVVLTLIPGSFKPDSEKEKKPGQVEIRKISFAPAAYGKKRIQHRRTVKKNSENQALKKAKVIVAAGRGLKEKENLGSVFKLAQCFPAAAVGASRPLVDMGWLEHQHQVGITGATVAPKLYLACGISGSSQHLAGIKEAEFVVSINKNPEAPIFRHSDICITADVIEFIETFIKK